MSDIMVTLPDNLGTVSFPADTPKEIIERESGNAYLRARGTASGRGDAGRSRDQGLSQAFGNGALQGAGDEASAAVRAALPGFSNWMMSGPALQRDESIGGSAPVQTVSDAPTYGGRYEEELARERAKKSAFADANPVMSGAATIAGAAAPVVLGGMAGLPMAPKMGGSLAGNLGKAAVTGAGYGGLFGFNEGEGDNRLGSAGEGATIGALLGPAFYGAGRAGGALWDFAKTTAPGQAALGAAQKVASGLDRVGSVKPASLSAAAPEGYVPGDNMATYAADQLRSVVPSPEEAIRQRAISFITTAVERGRMTAEQAQQRLAKLGGDATLADVNKPLFRATRMANTLQGETSELAEQVLTDRARTYNPRLRGAIEGEGPPPEDFYFRGDIPGGNIPERYAREVGARVYGAMNDAGFQNSPGVSRMIEQNPKVAAAVERVLTSLKEARQGTDRSPKSVVQVMHMVKREIQKIGEDAATGRPSSTGFHWQQTADNFVRALKAANPELAAADRAYAAAKSVPDFYEAGLGTFGKASTAQGGVDKSAAAVENMLRVADVAQGNAAQFGAINAGRAKTGGNVADAIGFARTIRESDEARRKIAATFGEERARQIFDAADSVIQFDKTRQGILGGSQTADKAAELFSTGADLGNAGVKVTPGGIVPRFFQTANDIMQRISAPNEATRNQMGRLLLNQNPLDNEATLSAVAEMLRQRGLQRQGGAVFGGLVPNTIGLNSQNR